MGTGRIVAGREAKRSNAKGRERSDERERNRPGSGSPREARARIFVDRAIKGGRERVKKKKKGPSEVSVNKSYFSYERKGDTSTSERGETCGKAVRSP